VTSVPRPGAVRIFTAAYRFVERLTRLAALAGVAALCAAMLITITDILLRNVASHTIVGVLDMVQLCIMATAFLAIPYAFMVGGHVGVDLATDPLPPRALAALKGLASLAGLAFMGAVGFYGVEQAVLQHGYGDASQTIGIPILWYWGPLILGSALSVAAAAVLALRFAIEACAGRDPVAAP
jgi:TRAP-type C4-dicarboxylate transport system permease small subunit